MTAATDNTAPEQRRFWRYLVKLAVLLLGLFGSVAAFNVLVDPFDAFGRVSIDALGAYKERFSRIAVAELMRQDRYDTLVLGSSRAQIGIDPNLPVWGEAKVFNAGLPGCSMFEVNHAFHYAAGLGDVRRVFLFVDIEMFTGATAGQHDFHQSRFDPALNLAEYHLQNLFGLHAIDNSRKVLRRARYSELARIDFNKQGFRQNKPPEEYRTTFDDTVLTYMRSHHFYGGFFYSPQRVAEFRDVVRACHERGLELHVAIPPIHAEQMEGIRQAGLWDDFARLRRDLAETIALENAAHPGNPPVQLMDFTGYSRFNTEIVPRDNDRSRRMAFYYDPSHSSTELGDLVIRRMLGIEMPEVAGYGEFGVVVRAENIEEHLQRLDRERLEWVQLRPWELRHVSSLALRVRLERRGLRHLGGYPLRWDNVPLLQ